MFPIADVPAGLALTNRSIVLAIVAIRIFSTAVWIEARAGGLLFRTHQRSTYQERIVQAHLTALAESGTPVKDQADQPLPILARYLGTVHRSSDDAIHARLGAGRQLIADEGVVRVD